MDAMSMGSPFSMASARPHAHRAGKHPPQSTAWYGGCGWLDQVRCMSRRALRKPSLVPQDLLGLCLRGFVISFADFRQVQAFIPIDV